MKHLAPQSRLAKRATHILFCFHQLLAIETRFSSNNNYTLVKNKNDYFPLQSLQIDGRRWADVQHHFPFLLILVKFKQSLKPSEFTRIFVQCINNESFVPILGKMKG